MKIPRNTKAPACRWPLAWLLPALALRLNVSLARAPSVPAPHSTNVMRGVRSGAGLMACR